MADPMDDPRTLSDLHAETQRNRSDFLQTEVALCFTFVELATTELQMSDLAAAKGVLAKAEEAYATIDRFLPRVDGGPEKEAIERKLVELRAKLDSLQQKINR